MPIRKLIALIIIAATLLTLMPALADNMPYHITVDCTTNIVTVYSTLDESIVRQMVCSTGTARYPSPHGTFTMPKKHKDGERSDWYAFEDGFGKWGSRIQGNYLFHSYLFLRKENDAVNWESYSAMGTNASHGCIRLYIDDAKWIADNCFAGTKVKIYDSGKSQDYIKELLYEQTYSIDSGLTYAEFISMAADDTELGYGSEGEKVKALQTRMTELGLYEGEIDGKYGAALVRAVKAIQTALGNKVTGVATQALMETLNSDTAPSSTISTLKPGASGAAVRSLQALLSQMGLFTGDIDGEYDEETVNAVKEFQRLCGYDATGAASGALQYDMVRSIDKLNAMYGSGSYALTYQSETVQSAINTSGGKLNMRAKKNTESTILARIPDGAEVELIDKGDDWSKIEYDSDIGFVRTEYLTVSEVTIRTPVYVQADAEHPAIQASTTLTGSVLRTQQVTYGIVNIKERLKVRKSPDTSANVEFMLSPGTPVRIISTSNSWAYISYGGKSGFAMLKYFDTKKVIELTGSLMAASAGDEYTGDDEILALVTKNGGAEMRASASDSGEVIDTLETGTRVSVIFESTAWTQVKSGDVTGYVNNDSIFTGTAEDLDGYESEIASAKATYAVVNTGADITLNMRAEPKPDGEVINKLENGTIIEIVAADGEWTEINYNWTKGYVMSMYIMTINDTGEYDPVAAGYDENVIKE